MLSITYSAAGTVTWRWMEIGECCLEHLEDSHRDDGMESIAVAYHCVKTLHCATKDGRLSVFSFPTSDEILRKQSPVNIRRADFAPGKYSFACIEHFCTNSFMCRFRLEVIRSCCHLHDRVYLSTVIAPCRLFVQHQKIGQR